MRNDEKKGIFFYILLNESFPNPKMNLREKLREKFVKRERIFPGMKWNERREIEKFFRLSFLLCAFHVMNFDELKEAKNVEIVSWASKLDGGKG